MAINNPLIKDAEIERIISKTAEIFKLLKRDERGEQIMAGNKENSSDKKILSKVGSSLKAYKTLAELVVRTGSDVQLGDKVTIINSNSPEVVQATYEGKVQPLNATGATVSQLAATVPSDAVSLQKVGVFKTEEKAKKAPPTTNKPGM